MKLNIGSISSVAALGALGPVANMVMDNDTKSEFKNTKTPEYSGTELVIIIVIFVILIAVYIAFLVAIYRAMPDYKVVHVIGSLLLGALWFCPALIHHCVTYDYVLVSPSLLSAQMRPTVGVNNRRMMNNMRRL